MIPKPCPYCKGRATMITKVRDEVASSFYIECRKCHARGPYDVNFMTALRLWDELLRALPDPAAPKPRRLGWVPKRGNSGLSEIRYSWTDEPVSAEPNHDYWERAPWLDQPKEGNA